ncbi:hypothetical protein [Sphingomonas sp. GM_Shp_2]|uniref:hypothetical protein n=1 Tax=Sphingomonas sp. GM_Shp_2 TaxID=2937380 RepID=UPI002269DB78|nr:hypothetical protein [Sphingomonas sp. GM_Shp_2]
MMMRSRILFGDHSTQAPAIERFVDHARFDVTFAAFDSVDFAAFDCVVPLRVDQIAAARAAGARAVLPSAELVAVCDDKLAFNQRVIALGFGDAIPPLLPDPPTTYPYIRKGRRGDFGVGCRMVRAPGEDVPIADSFCQHAVAGAVEYVLHLLRVDGRIRYSLCYAYDMGVTLGVRGAEQRALSTVPADPGAAYPVCVAILEALGFEGTCCFNYKLEEGRVRILELNPRFGGSLVGEVSAYLEALLGAMRR